MTSNTQELWRALAEPVRREIIEFLADGPKTTGAIVERFDQLCRTAVMKHLDVLVAADLIAVERSGRMRWNRLNRTPLEQICLPWVLRHARKMPAALERLKAVVEREPIGTQPKQRPRARTTSLETEPVKKG